MIGRSLILHASALKPVEQTIRRSRMFKPLVSRFIAGDTLDDALAAGDVLLQRGLFGTLDYLGENTFTEEEASAAKQTYMQMVRRIGQMDGLGKPNWDAGPDPLNISIKLTQLGLELGNEIAERNYHEVLACAMDVAGSFVRVDMEGSEYTQRTIEIVGRALEKFRNTGTVLQSYLYRTDQDVETMIQLKARVRLVKGAYLEPPAIAYADKAKVDEAFVRQGKRLLKDGLYPAIATHDEAIVKELLAYAEKEKIPKERFELQMLYGIRRDLQDSLRASGYNVRVYIPFGDKWYPYFTRRLAERPANALFLVRSLFKG